MTGIVDAKSFLKAMEKISGVLKKNEYLPLADIKVAFSGGRCTLTASDLTVWMEADIPAEGEDFSFVLSRTKNVMKACRHYDGGLSLTLSGSEKHPLLTMSCAGKTGEFPVETAELFPVHPTVEPEFTRRVSAAELFRRVQRISYASAVLENKPVYQGIRFEENKAWCVDGVRIALSEDDSLHTPSPFIVSADALKHLKSFGDQEVELAVGKKFMRISGEGLFLCARLLEPADTLSLGNVFPKQYRETYTVHRKQYIDALKYLMEFTGKKPERPIRFREGELSFSSDGTFSSVKLDISGECRVEYGFSAQYMLEALEQFASDEYVEIHITSTVSPIVLTGSGGNTALVLPVRLKEDYGRRAA